MSFITATTPENLQVDVSLNVFVKIVFNVDIDATSINQYTVILAETVSEEIIPGSPGYIYGTKTATFQLFDYLKEDTEFTLILVGGVDGILTRDGDPVLTSNMIIRFQTGSTIDPNLALAKRGYYDGTQPFLGEDGIYQQVYTRTGEPISHIVTTAGTVGPGGNIIPAPEGAEGYIPPSGEIVPIVVSTTPEHDATEIESGIVTIVFDIPVVDIVDDDYIGVGVVNFSGLFSASAIDYDYEVVDNTVTITINNLQGSCIYTVSLGNGYVFSFRTKIFPFYTTVQTIRSQLGSLIGKITDYDIEFLIYKHSYYLYDTYNLSDPPPNAAVRYVICAVKLDLIKRRLFEGGPVTRKRLADLEIDRGRVFAEQIGKLIEELEQCLVTNADILKGGTGTACKSAVKGKYDPRRPIASTSWRRLSVRNNFDFRRPPRDY